MITQSNVAIVHSVPQVKTSKKMCYDSSLGFADSITRLATTDEFPDIEKKEVSAVSREVDPIKVYEEMTMPEVDTVHRSSKIINDAEWNDELLALFLGGTNETIDISRAVNWNSTGDATLTAEQISELRGKYNLNNLSPQDHYDLMVDLTNMNAISGEDIESMFVSKLPPQGSYIVETNFYGSVPFGAGSIFDAINSDLEALGGLKNFMLSDEFWKMNPSASKDEYSDYIGFINQRTKRFNRLLQMLTAIRG